MLPPRVTNSPYAEEQLRQMVDQDADDWDARKTFARFLYDRGDTYQAAELIWEAPLIPNIDFEIAFASRILAKGIPRRAIRLLNAVLENNRNRPAQNLGMANALLHHGMVMQAARFYGAAIEADGNGDMLNADLEHFLLWIDDKEKMWGDFEGVKDELDELPWIKRDAKAARELRKAMNGHTTPVRVMSMPPMELKELEPIPSEKPKHDMYVQKPVSGEPPTPPPAVTIPMDRVATKDRLFDEKIGAESGGPSEQGTIEGGASPDAHDTPASTPATPKPIPRPR